MSSGFISEVEIEEKKRIRQEEWDKVRKPDDPLAPANGEQLSTYMCKNTVFTEAPEEKYDPRSLYDRLQEQKQKKDIEYEEAHKLKNMIKGLDDDEVDFLDLVDRSKMEAERRKYAEEAQEMEDFRSAVASLQERSLQERINNEVKKQPQLASAAGSSGGGSKSSQQRLLSGAVKRKSTADASSVPESKKTFTEAKGVSETQCSQEAKTDEVNGINTNVSAEKRKRSDDEQEPTTEGTMRCIGILPGMGHYHDSSDSEHSSNTDEELVTVSGFDLCGRKIKPHKQKSAR
ncbi:hypothetical protein B566_EDAN001289 [Ephemera danica]|nr:hypothetical protein B566_EDAN001289 [Ephemera danica]